MHEPLFEMLQRTSRLSKSIEVLQPASTVVQRPWKTRRMSLAPPSLSTVSRIMLRSTVTKLLAISNTITCRTDLLDHGTKGSKVLQDTKEHQVADKTMLFQLGGTPDFEGLKRTEENKEDKRDKQTI
jgi:hypothetical protein